jgi:uncharacterized BrkB/YihY/UPF0761 family membrane protein
MRWVCHPPLRAISTLGPRDVRRAVVRYDRADGGRLAAAVTYFSFFAAFCLALLGVAMVTALSAHTAVGPCCSAAS